MSEQANQLLFSPAGLLWLAGSVAAILILLGALNRRRSGLANSLREYVNRSDPVSEDADADSQPRSPTTAKSPKSANER